MKNLTTLLVVLLISTATYSQEYKEFRTTGITLTESEYDYDRKQIVEFDSKNSPLISFVMIYHEGTTEETVRIYINTNGIETHTDMNVVNHIEKSESRDFITYVLHSKMTGFVNLSYNDQDFSLGYEFSKIGDEKSFSYKGHYSGEIIPK